MLLFLCFVIVLQINLHWSMLMSAISPPCAHWIHHSSSNCISAQETELRIAEWEVNKATAKIKRDKEKDHLCIGHEVSFKLDTYGAYV